MRPLVIVGAGGFGREALDVVEAINLGARQWEVLGVVDDAPSSTALERLAAREVAHLGDVSWLDERAAPLHFVIGVGSPRARGVIDRRLVARGHRPATVVHPDAVIGSRVEIGDGSVICGGVQVSTNVKLGRQVHLNPNATIGHDAVLGDCVSINPGAVISGDVCIGTEALVGAGAVVLQGLSVGRGSLVGAAACVTKNVVSGSILKGVPAR